MPNTNQGRASNSDQGTTDLQEDAKKLIPPKKLADFFDEAIARMDRRFQGIEKPILTPWATVNDQLAGGLWPGLHVLVSGTGVGKSTWALQVALDASKQSIPVVYIGLELDELQVALRLAAEAVNTSPEPPRPALRWSELYTGKANKEQVSMATNAMGPLASLPFHLEPGSPNGWDAKDLERLAMVMREKYPEDTDANGRRLSGSRPLLFVLDYLQIIGDERDTDGRAARLDIRERIGRAAYFGRDIARRYGICVLMISSTARSEYGKIYGDVKDAMLEPDGRILRPDVLVGLGKESGEIENAADSVNVLVKWPDDLPAEIPGFTTGMVFATSKLRAGPAMWCGLRFNGHRFVEGDTQELASLIKKKGESSTSASRPPSKNPPRSTTADDEDDNYFRAILRKEEPRK